MSENESQRISPVPAWIAIILACAWVAAGAVFKLAEASPNDIPPVVLKYSKEWFSFDMATTYRWAVTIEIAVVTLALLRPRLGWFILAGQYTVFLLILVNLMLAGSASCGCFGGAVNVKPWEMMVIDAPLLLILLMSKPWKRLPKRPAGPMIWLALGALWAGAWWAPRAFFKTGDEVQPAPIANVDDQDPTTDTTEGTGVDSGPANPVDAQPDLGDFIELKPHEWVDQMIDQTQIGIYFDGDVFAMPDTAHVILYRRSCDHCREHMMELAMNPITDRPVVLIELRADGDEQLEDIIDMKPQTDFNEQLKSLPKGYGLQTPWTFEVEGFVVTSVKDVRSEMGD